jgi:hypothetical protein
LAAVGRISSTQGSSQGLAGDSSRICRPKRRLESRFTYSNGQGARRVDDRESEIKRDSDNRNRSGGGSSSSSSDAAAATARGSSSSSSSERQQQQRRSSSSSDAAAAAAAASQLDELSSWLRQTLHVFRQSLYQSLHSISLSVSLSTFPASFSVNLTASVRLSTFPISLAFSLSTRRARTTRRAQRRDRYDDRRPRPPLASAHALIGAAQLSSLRPVHTLA